MEEGDRTLSPDELSRYARHLVLPGVGEQGQLRIKEARVLVVGAGGLGAPALLYLGAAGVGTIGVIDFDSVELTNLQRQVIYTTADVGRAKIDAACERVADLNPRCALLAIRERLSAGNVEHIFADFDLVIDGTDNFAAHYLINDGAVTCGKPFVTGTLLRFEGMVTVCNALLPSGARGPTYRCLFPEPPAAGAAPSCTDAGILGVLPGMIGTLQATEALKLILGIGETLSGRLLIYDALTASFRTLKFSRDEAAVQNVRILADAEYAALSVCAAPPFRPGEISPDELREKLARGEAVTLIDVREPFERARYHIGGELIPSASVPDNLDRIPREGEVVVYCEVGARSGRIVDELRRVHGYNNLKNLSGGLKAYGNRG